MTDPDDPNALRDQLRALYWAIDASVAAHSPVCVASGRCCRFEEYGHTLFLSGPEAECLIDEAPPPCRPLDEGGSCPWQNEKGLCTAREARPIGCRVYFCDPSFQERSHAISEQAIRALKTLCAETGVPWRYAPLHVQLREAVAEGRLTGLEVPPGP